MAKTMKEVLLSGFERIDSLHVEAALDCALNGEIGYDEQDPAAVLGAGIAASIRGVTTYPDEIAKVERAIRALS